MKKPWILFRKVKSEWLLLLVLLLFLYCWLRLCHLRGQTEETVTGGEAYRPQSIIDTLRQEMGE